MGEILCSLSISFDSIGILCNSVVDGELLLLIFDGVVFFIIDWNIDDYDGMSILESFLLGNYSVVVIDILGCFVEVVIVFIEFVFLIFSCLELVLVFMVGGIDGIVSLIIDGGILFYEFSYFGLVSGVLVIDIGNYILDDLLEGNYIF